jgi:spoIIIJ-associated protein
MRSRRTRRRFERVIPKPEVVIEEGPAPSVAVENLEPSKARERRSYEATETDNEAFRRVCEELLSALDVDYEVEYEHADYQRARIEVGSKQAGLLIGRRGSGVDALEVLVGRMASHQCNHAVPVQCDVNDYRRRHEEELREEAVARAQRVLQTGDDEQFPPMHARDRRVVHLAVKELDPSLATYSVGQGGAKAVVIRREGADDN